MGSRGPTSEVETHERAGELIAALYRGHEKLTQLSDKYGVEYDALRHWRKVHVVPALREALGNDPELANLDPLEHMRSLYHRLMSHLDHAEECEDDWRRYTKLHSEARADLRLISEQLQIIAAGSPQNVQVNVLQDPRVAELMDRLEHGLRLIPLEHAQTVLEAMGRPKGEVQSIEGAADGSLN
jgi:hypothetical protein